MRNCKYCLVTFKNLNGKQFSNHVRWCNKNPDSEHNNPVKCDYCDFTTVKSSIKLHLETCALNPSNIKKCLECGKIVTVRTSKFCNHSCSAKYSNTRRLHTGGPSKGFKFPLKSIKCLNCNKIVIMRSNITKTKGKYCSICYRNPQINTIFIEVSCFICKTNFIRLKSNKTKTCSDECFHKLLSINSTANPNCGGETNYRKFKYENITMDSSWEVEIAKYLDSKNIIWKRTKKIMFWWIDSSNKKRRYYPDFYIEKYNCYLDTKNKWLMEQDDYKLKAVVKENNIKLFSGDVSYIKSIIDGWV